MRNKDEIVKWLDKSIARTEGKSMEDISWGDFVCVMASAIMTEKIGILPKGLAVGLFATAENVERMIRLSEILNATEGFERTSDVHRTEAPDGVIEDADERKRINDTFGRLMEGLDIPEG